LFRMLQWVHNSINPSASGLANAIVETFSCETPFDWTPLGREERRANSSKSDLSVLTKIRLSYSGRNLAAPQSRRD
jgi:hypothetical protein